MKNIDPVAYKFVELSLPLNVNTENGIEDFLSELYHQFGCTYSRHDDPWHTWLTRIVVKLNRHFDHLNLPLVQKKYLSFVGAWTYIDGKSGLKEVQKEETVLIKVGVESSKCPNFLDRMRELHKRIVGFGEKESWVVYSGYRIMEVPDGHQ